MFLKPILIAAAAALLSPMIAVAFFLLSSSDDVRQAMLVLASADHEVNPAKGSGQAENTKAFLKKAPLLSSSTTMVLRQLSKESGGWLTVVLCPQGQPFPSAGRCPSREIIRAPTAIKHAVSDVTPSKLNKEAGHTDFPIRERSSALPGQMALGES
jgi:hypothetical protein